MITKFLSDPFGLNAESLNALQMILRALIIFFAALILFRIAGVRTLGRQSTFDQLTALIVGSILGRAVVTGKPFFGNLIAVLVIVLLHRFIAWITFKSPRMGAVLKGAPLKIYADGQMQERNMAKEYITNQDIEASLHIELNDDNMDKIKTVYLERGGELSFVKTDIKSEDRILP